MANFFRSNLDWFAQVGMILFMEVYLFFQGLYSVMILAVVFLFMGVNYRKARTGTNVCIVVLGDVGRSPRMQYHALSFAQEKFAVDIVGYGDSKPREEILKNERIKIHTMRDPPNMKFLPSLLRYPMKVIFQSLQLLVSLFCYIHWPSHIMVQNPPALPTLAVVWFASLVFGSKYIIDWHNYGYTILGLSLGKSHFLVRIAEKFERYFGRKAEEHFCVTKAMKEDLAKNWGISRPTTLYDKPASIFKETPLESKHELFKKLSRDYPAFQGPSSGSHETAFTQVRDGKITMKTKRPAFVISSTSWTEDEDFSILLNALEKYETATEENSESLPDIVCAITGKGPQKSYYQEIIAKKQFKHVQICTPWLDAEDYPLLVGAADLGVCLHLSSSGLDLPMKVVDMFGCGLPVCAINFKCISELVKHEENGLIFNNEVELSNQFQDLLQGFPQEMKKLETFRDNLKEFQELRWEESWKKTVKPYLYT